MRPSAKSTTKLDANAWRLFRLMILVGVVQLGLLLVSAGTWRWANAWMYWGTILAFQLAFFTMMARHNPGLLNERGKLFKPDTKGFDRVVLRLYFFSSLSILVVAGVDVGRIGVSDIPFSLSVAALMAGALLGQMATWAMRTNPHFESTVRIQTDRNHRVIDKGPYRIVRHPGYLGALCVILSLPLILGSWLAYIPTAICVLLLATRTSLEDKTLHRELEGYADYAEGVRYRLIPGIW